MLLDVLHVIAFDCLNIINGRICSCYSLECSINPESYCSYLLLPNVLSDNFLPLKGDHGISVGKYCEMVSWNGRLKY